MPDRPNKEYRPALEGLEPKRLLSGGVSAGPAAHPQATPAGGVGVAAEAVVPKPNYGFLLYRITNPNKYNDHFVTPFTFFPVQTQQPIPGQTYNILFVTVRNGTGQTFDARSNFYVRFPGQARTYPILTGDQQWKPGQIFAFYVLSHKYYPLPSQVHSGFEFSLAGARSIGIPGPSGIFQRIKYDPATFDQTFQKIIIRGPGNQGGVGVHFGLPNTSIYEFVNSKTNRNDFSGYF